MADTPNDQYDNGDLDAFEAELTSFDPRPTSRGLHGRIADRLTTRRPRRLRMASALAGLAAAACVAVGVIIIRPGDVPTVVVNPPTPPGAPVQPVTERGAEPLTLIEYQRAIARSPDALDALLARPAGRERTAAEVRRADDVATAFTRSTASILNTTTTNGDSL